MPEIQTPAGKIYYRDSGEGTPLVLIHGNYGSSTWWKPLLGKVSDHRTVAPDLPGFGKSEKPETDHMIPTYSSYLDDFLNELGIEKFRLIGHSLGGAISLQYALDHPEKVEKLILVDPSPPDGLSFSLFQKLLYKIVKRSDRIIKRYFNEIVSEDHPLYEELWEDATSMKKSAVEGHVKALEEFDVTDRLTDLEPPLYVIRGENDSIIEDEDLKVYKDYGRYEVIKNTGHAPFVDAPEKFIELLEEILNE